MDCPLCDCEDMRLRFYEDERLVMWRCDLCGGEFADQTVSKINVALTNPPPSQDCSEEK